MSESALLRSVIRKLLRIIAQQRRDIASLQAANEYLARQVTR
jgi:hypothetical protein